MNYRLGDFPVTEKAAAEIVSLPMFPQLTRRQQGRVVDEVVAFAAARKQVESEAVSLTTGTRRG